MDSARVGGRLTSVFLGGGETYNPLSLGMPGYVIDFNLLKYANEVTITGRFKLKNERLD